LIVIYRRWNSISGVLLDLLLFLVQSGSFVAALDRLYSGWFYETFYLCCSCCCFLDDFFSSLEILIIIYHLLKQFRI